MVPLSIVHRRQYRAAACGAHGVSNIKISKYRLTTHRIKHQSREIGSLDDTCQVWRIMQRFQAPRLKLRNSTESAELRQCIDSLLDPVPPRYTLLGEPFKGPRGHSHMAMAPGGLDIPGPKKRD